MYFKTKVKISTCFCSVFEKETPVTDRSTGRSSASAGPRRLRTSVVEHFSCITKKKNPPTTAQSRLDPDTMCGEAPEAHDTIQTPRINSVIGEMCRSLTLTLRLFLGLFGFFFSFFTIFLFFFCFTYWSFWLLLQLVLWNLAEMLLFSCIFQTGVFLLLNVIYFPIMHLAPFVHKTCTCCRKLLWNHPTSTRFLAFSKTNLKRSKLPNIQQKKRKKKEIKSI